MNQEQFKREKNYRVSLAIAKVMLSKCIISDKDYHKIDEILIDKYKPVIGSL